MQVSVEHTPATPSLCLYTALQYCLLGELLRTLQESVKFYIHNEAFPYLSKMSQVFPLWSQSPPHTHYIIMCVLFIYFSLSRL